MTVVAVLVGRVTPAGLFHQHAPLPTSVEHPYALRLMSYACHGLCVTAPLQGSEPREHVKDFLRLPVY